MFFSKTADSVQSIYTDMCAYNTGTHLHKNSKIILMKMSTLTLNVLDTSSTLPTKGWETNSTSLASLVLYWNVQNLLQKGVCKWTHVHTNGLFTNRYKWFFFFTIEILVELILFTLNIRFSLQNSCNILNCYPVVLRKCLLFLCFYELHYAFSPFGTGHGFVM